MSVQGTRTILNTQTLSVEDNFIEVNLQSDGSETAQYAGLHINRGTSATSVNSNNWTNDNVGNSGGGVEWIFASSTDFDNAWNYGGVAKRMAHVYEIYTNDGNFSLSLQGSSFVLDCSSGSGANQQQTIGSFDAQRNQTMNSGWSLTWKEKTQMM